VRLLSRSDDALHGAQADADFATPAELNAPRCAVLVFVRQRFVKARRVGCSCGGRWCSAPCLGDKPAQRQRPAGQMRAVRRSARTRSRGTDTLRRGLVAMLPRADLFCSLRVLSILVHMRHRPRRNRVSEFRERCPAAVRFSFNFEVQLLGKSRVLFEVVPNESGELLDRATDRFLCLLQQALADRSVRKRFVDLSIKP